MDKIPFVFVLVCVCAHTAYAHAYFACTCTNTAKHTYDHTLSDQRTRPVSCFRPTLDAHFQGGPSLHFHSHTACKALTVAHNYGHQCDCLDSACPAHHSSGHPCYYSCQSRNKAFPVSPRRCLPLLCRKCWTVQKLDKKTKIESSSLK